MGVFVMVSRKTVTSFLVAKESTSVREVENMITGIIKVEAQSRMLCKDD